MSGGLTHRYTRINPFSEIVSIITNFNILTGTSANRFMDLTADHFMYYLSKNSNS